MPKIICVAGVKTDFPINNDYLYVGVDRGALYIAEKNITMEYAIGDFDSITCIEYEKIKANSKKIIKLNPCKDDSDTEHALRFLSNQYDDIDLYGVCGKRLDHFLNVFKLLENSDINFSINDEKNKIYKLKKGEYKIDTKMKYFSIYAIDEAIITLKNVKYPLERRKLIYSDLYCLSNEAEADAIIIVHSGEVIFCETND